MNTDPLDVPAGLVLVGEWSVARPADQRRAADAALAAWEDGTRESGARESRTLPPGLRSHDCLLGEDGESVLHYLRWSGPDACDAFVGTDRPRWLRSVDAAVPGIRHHRATAYLVYRSTTTRSPDPAAAGCVATVTVDFEGPDAQRQRDWIDNVFAASGTGEASVAAGLIAAHFHVSVDGTRVLNVAEWTTAQAHREAATVPAPRLRTATQHFPGVAGIAVRRFAPYRSVAPRPS